MLNRINLSCPFANKPLECPTYIFCLKVAIAPSIMDTIQSIATQRATNKITIEQLGITPSCKHWVRIRSHAQKLVQGSMPTCNMQPKMGGKKFTNFPTSGNVLQTVFTFPTPKKTETGLLVAPPSAPTIAYHPEVTCLDPRCGQPGQHLKYPFNLPDPMSREGDQLPPIQAPPQVKGGMSNGHAAKHLGHSALPTLPCLEVPRYILPASRNLWQKSIWETERLMKKLRFAQLIHR